MADLQVILSSGEIVEIYIRDTGEPNRVLRKEEIEALISQLQVSLGNYSFDGDEMSVSGDRVLNASGAITTLQSVQDDGGYGYFRLSEDYIAILYHSGTALNTFRMDETGAQFIHLTIEMIDAAGTKSVTTKEWSLGKFFQKDEFINVYTGQSGVPIVTSDTGKVDTSLLSVSIGELQGNFTPTAGTEYPDITGMVAGDYWIIENVGGIGSGYTFTGGQLSGQTIYDNAWMQLDTNLLWVISNNSGGTNVQWGGIGGSLPAQTDIDNRFNAVEGKADQNETDITTKASQTDLDATNTVVDGKLETVATDSTITGDGTSENPLSVTGGGTGESNFVNFSGSEGNTAAQNAQELGINFQTADEVFFKKGTYQMDTITIVSGKTLRFENGAILNVTGTMTGNFTQIKADQNQIFTLTSNLQGSWNAPQAHVEWFGAKGDLTGTQDAAAMNKTLSVFTNVTEYISGGWESFGGQQNEVVALGMGYNIEETVHWPQFCQFRAGINTLMINGYNDMYDSMFSFTQDPVFIKCLGQVRIRKYNDYASSPPGIGISSPLAEKETYAYNKNPVIYGLMDTLNNGSWDKQLFYRQSTIIEEVDCRLHASQYEDSNRWTLLYDFLRLEVNFQEIDPGFVFDIDHEYYIETYVSGDDFSNIGGSNSSGSKFRATGTTPANWTNGSVLRHAGTASYWNRFQNLTAEMANIFIYVQGATFGLDGPNSGGYGGMYNSAFFSNCISDGCNQSIVLGSRASGNTFSNHQVQNTPYGRNLEDTPSQVDIYGSLNYIDGIGWDFPQISGYKWAVRLRSAAVGNIVNLAVQGNRLSEAFTQYDNVDRNNDVGSHVPFSMSEDGSAYTRYWAKTGLGVIDNDTFNFDLLNRNNGQIEAIGSVTIKAKPMFVASPQTNEGGGQSGDIKTRNFAYPTAYAVSPQRSDGLSYGGFGSQIGWYLNDEDATDAFQYFLGSVGFRQKQATNARDGSKGVYQIWRHVDGEDYNSMTIQDDGKIGINGVTRPSETIDLVGDTNNVSGAKNTGTSIKIDKVKLEPTDTSGALPAGSSGELRSGDDGSLLYHDGTGWNDVNLTPRP